MDVSKEYIIVDSFTGYLTDGRGNYWGYTNMKIEKEETEDGVKFKLVQYLAKMPKDLEVISTLQRLPDVNMKITEKR